MKHKCYFCKCVPDKVKRISLYSFPDRQKYPDIYNQWLAVCNLNEIYDVSRTRICSNHFPDEDKLMDYQRPRIKLGAIPSINITNPNSSVQQQKEQNHDGQPMDYKLTQIKQEASINVKNPKSMEQQQKEQNNDEITTLLPHNKQTSDLVSTVEELSQISEKVIVENLRNMDELDKHFELLCSYMVEKKPCTTIAFSMSADSAPMENFILDSTYDVPGTSTTKVESSPKRTMDTTKLAEKSLSEDQNPQKKRRHFYPRYISELQIPDLATPRIASQTIQLIKQEDQRKSRKIKYLQDTNRLLEKRVSSLLGLLSNVKKRGKIAKDPEKTILDEELNS